MINAKKYINQLVDHPDADYHAVEAFHDHNGKPQNIQFHSPNTILPNINSPEDVQTLVDYYSHDVYWQDTLPDDTFARCWYVEKIRPALRYYCQKFGIQIPAWLTNEDRYKNLPESQKSKLFGKSNIVPIVFKKMSSAPEGHDEQHSDTEEA